jgi:hypothetical protein
MLMSGLKIGQDTENPTLAYLRVAIGVAIFGIDAELLRRPMEKDTKASQTASDVVQIQNSEINSN